MKKKVLILGNSAKEYALAKKLSLTCEVHVAPRSDTLDEFVTGVDIREDSIKELLEYVMENGIDMTIVASEKALKTKIVDLFSNNGQTIFAPSFEASHILLDKSNIKKLLYKLRIPTPKFGIFEKQNMAMDYIKNLSQPFVIKTNEPLSAVIVTDKNVAKKIIDFHFMEKQQRVIIEDYLWGIPFSFYAITDGYNALPIGSSVIYKHSLNGNGGQLTSGMGASSPNNKLSIDKEKYIIKNVIYPTLNYLVEEDAVYVGIIGVNGIITESGDIQVLGYQTFMQDSDCAAILELIDEDVDMYELFISCIIGSFSDEYENISLKNRSATTVVLTCTNTHNSENSISGLEDLDEDINLILYPSVVKNKYLEIIADKGPVASLTASALTPAASARKIFENIERIKFKGIHYRSDICQYLD